MPCKTAFIEIVIDNEYTMSWSNKNQFCSYQLWASIATHMRTKWNWRHLLQNMRQHQDIAILGFAYKWNFFLMSVHEVREKKSKIKSRKRGGKHHVNHWIVVWYFQFIKVIFNQSSYKRIAFVDSSIRSDVSASLKTHLPFVIDNWKSHTLTNPWPNLV